MEQEIREWIGTGNRLELFAFFMDSGISCFERHFVLKYSHRCVVFCRGNSKYHYYGIRVKPDSPLARLTDDTQVAMRQQPNPQKK